MCKIVTHLIAAFLVLSPALVSMTRAELVGWWKFDETSGTIANDSSGGGNHGTVQGGGQWVPGQLGGGLLLDGDNDYVELPIGSLMGSLESSTLALWVNFTGEGENWQRILDFGTGTANYLYLCPRDGNGYLHVAITADTGLWTDLTHTTVLPTGWHHVAVVLDRTMMTMRILLDGDVIVQGSTLYTLSDLGATNQNWIGRSQYSADDYFHGTVDDLRIYDEALSPAEVVKASRGETGVSSEPNPPTEADDVPRDTILSWTAGEFADTHNVYLGTDFDTVNTATVANPQGVLASQGKQQTFHDPGRLQFGQTYFWRVDEVNATPADAIFKGQVWKFTVEPYSYPIEDVNATASSSHDAANSPERTVDGSGLGADDAHSTNSEDMWLSAKGSFPHTIEYMFDKVYKLDQMWVWNSNQSLESMFGLGAKDVAIQYSTNGTDWTDLGNFAFAKASGSVSYVANTKIDFSGVPAKYVRLTISSNWGGIFTQVGLSEVRFMYLPVAAREPSPAANATDVHPQVTLSWRAGREADSHEVYVGTDTNAVADGTVPMTTVSQPQYETALDLEQSYSWKVIEVNQAEAPSSWESSVWSFSTATYITVDDFEDYTNDSPNRVFQTWIDGTGFSADEFFPNGSTGNGTGALVGYDPMAGDIMELALMYGGRQSMPLVYDGPRSEADRTFNPPQDWTKHNITTLVLFFRGDPGNGGAPVYVKINGVKVTYNNGAASTTTPVWKQWNIDLASVAGANLASVQTLTIGVGDDSVSASGTLFIDEIRLYATAPEVVIPADPGTNGLAAFYSMENNVQDSSGNNLHGTANGDPGYVDGKASLGKALNFDGVNDYVNLPIGTLLSTLSSSTLAAWVNWAGSDGDWQRVLDFGTGTTFYMFLTVNAVGGVPRFSITTSGNAAGAESMVTALVPLGTGWRHLAVVIDGTGMTLSLYVDGVLAASGPTSTLPRDLGVTTQNWLGRSQWTEDAYFTGSLDDLRIYNRALSESEIRYLAGDR